MLINCIECSKKISDKAVICPRCGIPMKNGSFQVRIDTRIDESGYSVFRILGSDENSYDNELRKLTFAEVFQRWYTKKYGHSPEEKVGSYRSSEYTTRAAYKKFLALHERPFSKIRAYEMQEILDDKHYSHATTEHMILLLKSMGKYALEYDIIMKDYTTFLRINKEDDDKHGIPFTKEELALLWENKEKPFVDTILIYCYSGWRLNELAKMPLENINLEERTFKGGLKTRFSKNRVVPMHSQIFPLVKKRYDSNFKSLIYHDGASNISMNKYREHFAKALSRCGIEGEHTPHDCRHTCNALLDEAEVNRNARYKIMGHTGKDINERIYAHKNIDQLRKAIEKMWVP